MPESNERPQASNQVAEMTREHLAKALCELAYWIYPSDRPWVYVHVSAARGRIVNVAPLEEPVEFLLERCEQNIQEYPLPSE